MTALDETARESGTAYNAGHAMVWDQLAQTRFPGASVPAVARLVSVPGACTHVALVGRCPTAPGEIAVLKADADDVRLEARLPDRPAGVQAAVHRRRHLHAEGRRTTGSGSARGCRPRPVARSPPLIPSRPAPWITTQAGIELASNNWFVTVDQSLRVTPELTPDDAARPPPGCAQSGRPRTGATC